MQDSTALLRIALYGSWFGLGVTAYMGLLNLLQAIRTKSHERRLNIAYFAARVGLIITLGLVTLRILAPAQALPVNADTILYTIGVLMVGSGYLGIAIETKNVDRRRYK